MSIEHKTHKLTFDMKFSDRLLAGLREGFIVILTDRNFEKLAFSNNLYQPRLLSLRTDLPEPDEEKERICRDLLIKQIVETKPSILFTLGGPRNRRLLKIILKDLTGIKEIVPKKIMLVGPFMAAPGFIHVPLSLQICYLSDSIKAYLSKPNNKNDDSDNRKHFWNYWAAMTPWERELHLQTEFNNLPVIWQEHLYRWFGDATLEFFSLAQEIIHPRFFLDLRHPGSLYHLFNYMGLVRFDCLDAILAKKAGSLNVLVERRKKMMALAQKLLNQKQPTTQFLEFLSSRADLTILKNSMYQSDYQKVAVMRKLLRHICKFVSAHCETLQ